MQDSGVHEPLGAGVGLGAGSPETNLYEAGASDESAEEIKHSGKAHDRREQADSDKRGGIKNDLAKCARAVFVDNRKHENAGAGVVFTIHPRNSVEVRELPDEEDGEEEPGASVEFAGGGRPADHRRDCAGDGANECCPDGALLERRVSEEIAEGSEDTEEAGDVSGGEVQVDCPGNAKDEAEAEGFGRSELPSGKRTGGGAAHIAIGFTFNVMIQRGSAGGNHHGAADNVEHVEPGYRAARAHVETSAGSHEDEERDVRLSERNVRTELHWLREPGGAGVAH